jgi:hypothetical protein
MPIARTKEKKGCLVDMQSILDSAHPSTQPFAWDGTFITHRDNKNPALLLPR